jgi:hypothetical protein
MAFALQEEMCTAKLEIFKAMKIHVMVTPKMKAA